MLCEECGKRPAVVHLTKIVNGTKSEVYLCEECAYAKGGIQANISLNEFMKNFMGINQEVNPSQRNQQAEPRCPHCGLAYHELAKNSKLGCAHCYQYFGTALEPLLRRIHGSSQHAGKIPHRAGERYQVNREIEMKRAELQRCIAREEYEKAAQIRDRLRALEQQGQGEGGQNNGLD